MAAKLLHIEIGDRVSKVCLSVQRGHSCQIETCFLFATPEGVVSDGVISDPETLAKTLTEQMESHGVSATTEAVFSLSSGRVATREVLLPPVKDNRIQALVETNASDYFPVDMSNYQITYTLLERRKGAEPGLRVLVMAAPTALLEAYITLADHCGLKIRSVDYSANSQYQALRGIKREGVTMYVNVGSSSTYTTFLKDGNLLLQRTFIFGGSDLINSYLAAQNRPAEDFLPALEELTGPNAVQIDQIDVAETLDRLVGSIVRSCDYFTSTQGENVGQIVLMGPCAHLPHLCALIASGSGVETVYLEEIPGVEQLANAAESAACYISCIGSSIAPADLLPEAYKNRKKRKSKQGKSAQSDDITGGIIICGVCILASLVLCATSVFGYLSQQKKLQAMQARMEELSYVEQVYNTYVTYTQNQEGLQVVRDAARGHNAELEAFFVELEQKMPSSILLLTASCNEEGVLLDVTVPSFTESAVTINQLRSFDSIDVIQVSDVAEEVSEAGVKRASFSVSCLYPVPVVEETELPEQETPTAETPEDLPEETPAEAPTETEG